MGFVGLGGLLVFLLTSGAALAQPCPADLRPVADDFGYRHRPTPDRCEGLYSAPVAGEGLEVLAFVASRSAFDRQTDRTLIITAPDVHVLGAQRVAVLARALPLRVYYRMDAVLPSAGSMQWPVGDVVLPAGLDPAKIGLIGTVQSRDGNVYVPLQLSSSSKNASQDATQPTIIFRTPVDLESFQWRLYEPGGAAASWSKYGHAVHAGDPITVTLDAPAGKIMTLDVAARPVGGEFIQSRLKIFRP
jgi:hypothetical protein